MAFGVMPFLAYMASGSRSPELVGWLRCVLGLVLLAAELSWQERPSLGELNRGISANKADSWSSSPLVVSRAAGGSSTTFFPRLPWRKAEEEASGTGSLNKRGHRQIESVHAEISLLAGLGGGGRRKLAWRSPVLVDAGVSVLQL